MSEKYCISELARYNAKENPLSRTARGGHMPVRKAHYETLLAEYSDARAAIDLLKQHRPYLELVPSMRRPDESLITIPLPIARVATTGRVEDSFAGLEAVRVSKTGKQLIRLPCDLVILMCDPDWKVKTETEIFVFIHRPEEDFSEILGRWRQTQVYLDQGYEWLMPRRYQHILSDGSDEIFPLFVLFEETPDRIQQGLRGAFLPTVVQPMNLLPEEEISDSPTSEELPLEEPSKDFD